MSKLSAFFEKKKKKSGKAAPPPELAQVIEKQEEPLQKEDAGWGLQPDQEITWTGAASPAAAAAGGAAATAGAADVAFSLKVSAVGASVLESKRDKSWSAMKKLDEEQRRGIQELREQEARELLLLQQQQQQQQLQEGECASVASPSQEGAAQGEAAETKPFVSLRVLRALEGGSLLRKGKGAAPAPSFDEDPDLATAVQMASSRQQAKKQPQSRKSPSSAQQQNGSPAAKAEEQQQEAGSSTSVCEDETDEKPSLLVFDVCKFVSFEGCAGANVPLDASLVRAKYETRALQTPIRL